ncbi:MAG: aspartate/glutamate racemase family protein [Candidatus Thorarchaeota archaeon]
MEILYLLPGSGMPEEELERRTKITNQISRPDANVTAIEVGVGPLSIESAIEEYMSIGPMLEWLRSNREEGKYDAIIIGCAGDPGIRAARELMDIPVIGPAESSYHFACMVSDRFSILLTPQAGVESDDSIRVYVRELGLENRLASVEFVDASVVDMWNPENDSIGNQVSDAIDRAKKKGAGSVVFGCMSMAFLLLDEKLNKSSLPIVNPLKTAIKTAEMFVDLKMGPSRMTYPAADLKKLDETVFKK